MSAPRVTNRTDYAVRAAVYLALQDPGCIIPISEIALETGLSVKFLEEILLLLRTAGLVQSRRGKQGGYALIRPPQDLTIAEIVQALEGDRDPGASEGDLAERQPFRTVAQGIFGRAACAWWNVLAQTRLSSLAEEIRRLQAERSGADMFHI